MGFATTQQNKPKQAAETAKKVPATPVLPVQPVPSTNAKAKPAANNVTATAKSEGSALANKARSGVETKKQKDISVKIYDKKIIRRLKDGKVVYIDPKTNRKIPNLAVWIKANAKPELVLKNLSPFTNHLKDVPASERTKITGKLNKLTISDIQNNTHPKQQIERAKVVLSVDPKAGDTLRVSPELAKLKYKKYLDFNHVLPANARTIVVTRGGESAVCIREIEGGRTIYRNLATGKRVSMKPNDSLQIVGSVAQTSKAYKDAFAAENAAHMVQVRAGKVFVNDRETAVPIAPKGRSSSGGSRSGGGGGGGGGGASPRTSPSSGGGGGGGYKPAPPIKPDKPSPTGTPTSSGATSSSSGDTERFTLPRATETSETTGEYATKTIRSPEVNGNRPIHLFIPEKLDPKKPTHVIYYFHGFTSPKVAANELLKKPTDWSKKHMLSPLKKMAKTHNIVFAMPEGESGKSKWYDLQSENRFNKFDAFVRNQSGADKTKGVKRYIMGHSGAYIAMNGILDKMPPNYFDGLGLFDTLYGEGKGTAQITFRRLKKHDKMKVFSLFESVAANRGSSPRRHNVALQKYLQRNSGARKAGDMQFQKTDLKHKKIKAPGVTGALKMFLKDEPVVATKPKKKDEKKPKVA